VAFFLFAGIFTCTVTHPGCAAASDRHIIRERRARSAEAQGAFREAEQAYKDGNLDDAHKAFESFLSSYPSDPLGPAASLYLGRIELDRDNPGKAYDILTDLFAREDFARDLDLLLLLGRSLVMLERYAEAWDVLKPLAGSFPDMEQEETLLRLLAQTAHRLGKKIEAIGFFDLLLSLSPDDSAEISLLISDLAASADSGMLQKAYISLDRKLFAWGLVVYRLAYEAYEDNDLDRVQALIEDAWMAGRTDLERLAELDELVRRRSAVDPFTVGCLLPLSGRGRVVGEKSLKGLMLAADAFTAPVRGPAFSLAMRDVGDDARAAARGVEELVIDERAIAIVGPLDSLAAEAAADRAEELGVPIITLSARSPEVPGSTRYVFHNFPTPGDEVNALVNEAVKVRKHRHIAVIVPANGYGMEIEGRTRTALREKGLEIVTTLKYDMNTKSFVDIATELASKPSLDAVMLAGDTESVRLALPALAARGLWSSDTVSIPDDARRVTFLIPGMASGRSLLRAVGRYMMGAISATGFFRGASAHSTAFAERFDAEYNTEPDVYAAFSYDSFHLVGRSVEAGARTRAEVRDAFSSARAVESAASFGGFNKNGNALKSVVLVTYSQDGARVLER